MAAGREPAHASRRGSAPPGAEPRTVAPRERDARSRSGTTSATGRRSTTPNRRAEPRGPGRPRPAETPGSMRPGPGRAVRTGEPQATATLPGRAEHRRGDTLTVVHRADRPGRPCTREHAKQGPPGTGTDVAVVIAVVVGTAPPAVGGHCSCTAAACAPRSAPTHTGAARRTPPPREGTGRKPGRIARTGGRAVAEPWPAPVATGPRPWVPGPRPWAKRAATGHAPGLARVGTPPLRAPSARLGALSGPRARPAPPPHGTQGVPDPQGGPAVTAGRRTGPGRAGAGCRGRRPRTGSGGTCPVRGAPDR